MTVRAVVKTPSHRGAAFELLNRMLVESDAQLAVARTIRDESNAETDVEILVNAFEFLRNNADETSERISAHLSFAEQLSEQPARAFDATVEAYRLSEGDPEIELLLEALADEASLGNYFIDELKERAKEGGERRIEILMKIASHAELKLDDPQLAIELYREVLADEPLHELAFSALEYLLDAQETSNHLRAAYRSGECGV